MKLFNRKFKPNKKHSEFSKVTQKVIGEYLNGFDFQLYKNQFEKFFTTLIWKKNNQYLKISASDFPTDYPYIINVIIGEGNCDDSFETEWDSLNLSNLKKVSQSEVFDYGFSNTNKFEESLQLIKLDLEKYCTDFLNGELNSFYQIRKKINGEKKPIKITVRDKNGNVKFEQFPFYSNKD